MARAALPGRLTWRAAQVTGVHAETPTAATVRLRVPDWPDHLAGQHVDLRLTGPDGYTAVRSYSLAAPADADTVEVTVEEVPGGEVSPYLVREVRAGDLLEVRGPLGGWFVWRPEQREPIQLVAGGSGIVPLVHILRSRAAAGGTAPTRLTYSVRSPDHLVYADELAASTGPPPLASLTVVYTRVAPARSREPAGRLTSARLAASALPAADEPTCYVCGPTGFVEQVARWLVEAGHAPDRIRTERFGASGGAVS